jgi:hypothetical protein
LTTGDVVVIGNRADHTANATMTESVLPNIIVEFETLRF